jgi:hypothetical protein
LPMKRILTGLAKRRLVNTNKLNITTTRNIFLQCLMDEVFQVTEFLFQTTTSFCLSTLVVGSPGYTGLYWSATSVTKIH